MTAAAHPRAQDFGPLFAPMTRDERKAAGFRALQAWILALPGGNAHSPRWTVQVDIGKISMVTRGNSGPGTPYHHDRRECIRHIKNALAGRGDTRTDEAHARWERGRRAVSRGDFDALGQAVFGHHSGRRA